MTTATGVTAKRSIGFLFGMSSLMLGANLVWVAYNSVLLPTLVENVMPEGKGLAVGLIDIDNFKKINDSFGHDVGDQALVHLAQVVRETLRPQDTLARYGGEEFVVILPDTPLESAVTAMVRVQRELTRQFFLHNQNGTR